MCLRVGCSSKGGDGEKVELLVEMKTSLYLVADAEVAADRERLGLLLHLGRTLRLALDPLRTRRSCACHFAHRAPVFSLAVRAAGAHQAVAFQLAA